MSYNSELVTAYASTAVALTGKSAGSNTSATKLVLNPGGAHNIDMGSLVANVSALVKTSTIVVATRWEGSNDGSTWVPIYGINSPANVAVAAAGTGSNVTTAYAQAFVGNHSYPFVRLAVVNTVANGTANDVVTISYNWRRRWV